MGESETIGKFQHLFEAITTKGLIYRKKQAQPQMLLNESFVPLAAKKTIKPLEKADLLTVLGDKVDHLITSEYGPATLLVNNNLDILVFRGDVSAYLMPESGAASFNVTKIIRKELRSQIQTAIYRAKKEKKAFKETVRFKQKGKPKTVSIEIRQLEAPKYDEPFYLVLLTEASSNDLHSTHEVEVPVSPGEAESLKDRQIRELREDLDATKQSLQTLVEGQEATNEELRSSMEEVQSSNEELQSTNEELETAKEELQSGNEELQTLNEELKNRNQALARLNDDLANLQTNLDIAVVIVDSGLRIRRFTAAAQELLRISPSDVGGSIANIAPGVHIQDLDKLITEVIDKLAPIRQEVEGLEGHFYEMRVRPYLTEDKRIDGAFLSFTDITNRKKAEEGIKRSEEKYRQIVETAEEGIWTAKPDGTTIYVNQKMADMLGYAPEEIVGKIGVEFLAKGQESMVLQTRKDLERNVRLQKEFQFLRKDGTTIWTIANTAPIFEHGKHIANIAMHTDITKRKKAEAKLEEYQKNLEKLVEERTKQLR
ncbi:MAG TPA: PAS domain S-box protein, partial [Candidatus Sulfotelmatobacter sp.]|nr:PAS domain S-box protein [Candidatus Sulfotelmatobacter sp.]